MDAVSRRWHKPKKRSTKRSRLCAEKIRKRWALNETNAHIESEYLPSNNILTKILQKLLKLY